MLKELGLFKDKLSSLFVNDDKICKLLLGENYEDEIEDLDTELDKYIIPHLYVPDTITETKSYIMFDNRVIGTNRTTETLQIIIQAICHKDIVKYREKPKGYYGLRYDVLSQYIEELLCPDDDEKMKTIIKKFGIGSPELKSVGVDVDKKYVWRILTLNIPTFR